MVVIRQAHWPANAHRVGIVLLVSLLCLGVLACGSANDRKQAALDQSEDFLLMGDSRRAVSVLEGFLTYDPRDTDVLARLAQAHLDGGHPGKALYTLQSVPGDVDGSAVGLDLWLRVLLANGELNRSGAMLKRLEASGEAPEDLLRELWTQLAWNGIPRGFDLPDPWRLRVVEEQLRLQLPRHALDTLESAGERPANQEALYRKLLETLIRQTLDHNDEELLRRLNALPSLPSGAWTLLLRHRLLQIDGRQGEAGELEERFLSAYAKHPLRYHMLLSAARREIRSGRAESGLERSREAAFLQPTRPEPLVEQALALRVMGRDEEAEQILEMALGMAPDHAAARRLLQRADQRADRADRPAPAELRLTVAERPRS